MAEVNRLIAETEKWLKFHRSRLAWIEAFACNIRLRALREAKRAFEADGK
jgi:hypothetical protein